LFVLEKVIGGGLPVGALPLVKNYELSAPLGPFIRQEHCQEIHGNGCGINNVTALD
jgi:glutamate-1-semialdehyde aminotransferase